MDSSRDLAFPAHHGVLGWETSGSRQRDLSCRGTAELTRLLPFYSGWFHTGRARIGVRVYSAACRVVLRG